RGLIDVGAWDVPSRREARLVQDYRALGIGDDAILMANHKIPGSLADVDAMVAVGGMAHNPFILFVKRVHGRPSKRNPRTQFACVGRQISMLPRSSRCALLARLDGVPGRKPEVRVPCGLLVAF